MTFDERASSYIYLFFYSGNPSLKEAKESKKNQMH